MFESNIGEKKMKTHCPFCGAELDDYQQEIHACKKNERDEE
jgi:heterodisulfide reductase subunit B